MFLKIEYNLVLTFFFFYKLILFSHLNLIKQMFNVKEITNVLGLVYS